jgi:YesN/AraC family two-component response regulator
VYRTSKPEDKKALLGAFRQVSQELGEKKRKESEKEQQRRKSMWHGDVSIETSESSTWY